MKLSIEKATLADVAEILELQRLAYKSEAEIYNDFTIQPLAQTLKQAQTEFAESVVLKAVDGGKIIGSVRGREKGDTAFIGKLMVAPDEQNKGVGKRLLQAIEREFTVGRFELFTGDKSEKNIAVYEKSGYKIFKTEFATDDLSFVYMEKTAKSIKGFIAPIVLTVVLLAFVVAGTNFRSSLSENSDNNNNPQQSEQVFQTNKNGQTYGSAMNCAQPEDFPDLIGVEATNGKEGYVYYEDWAGYVPSPPEDAVRYMDELKALNEKGIYSRVISVYEDDGKTIVGKFEIGIDVSNVSIEKNHD